MTVQRTDAERTGRFCRTQPVGWYVSRAMVPAKREGLPVQPGGDTGAEAPGGSLHMQHPILTGHNGGGGQFDDVEAYCLVASACEDAVRRLCLTESCEATLRRLAALAHEAERLRLRELQPSGLRQVG